MLITCINSYVLTVKKFNLPPKLFKLFKKSKTINNLSTKYQQLKNCFTSHFFTLPTISTIPITVTTIFNI